MTRHRRSRRNPAVAAHRASVQQDNTGALVTAVVLGGGIGFVLYLINRSNTSATTAPALVVPNPPATMPAPSLTVSRVGPTAGPNGPDPSPAVVARLRSNDSEAKNVFGIQAMAYSYRVTDAIPDGIDGPVTDALISTMTGGQSTTYGPSVPANARAYVDNLGVSPRLLPFTLPMDVIDSVNEQQHFIDSGAHPLQVLPTIGPSLPAGNAMMVRNAGYAMHTARIGSMSMHRPTTPAVARPSNASPVRRPAAQAVIPYAGFDRPLTVLPTNAVGSNPGYGVMTDPRGLHIGLWDAIEGRYHAPLGTGIVAADNGANPIAGQPGGYWSGYR